MTRSKKNFRWPTIEDEQQVLPAQVLCKIEPLVPCDKSKSSNKLYRLSEDDYKFVDTAAKENKVY